MIYQAILKIGGKEIPLLYYSYRCHIRHCDEPNLGRIIQLHIQVCEEIGNRENLPVEGDLITLMFECSGDEQFFYDWLNEGAMHYGEIHFIYNENEVVDIFRFWDCFCLKIEEGMSAGNSPMVMTVYLSPGIIKRNNLEAREKEWKVSEVSQQPFVSVVSESKEEKRPEIVEVYWKGKNDEIIKIIPDDGIVTLYAKTKNTNAGDILSFSILLEDGTTMIKIDNCVIDSNGIAKVSNFDLKQYKHTFNI